MTQDGQLRAALIRDLNDPAPGVRLNAARGLWQWSYWSEDEPTARNNILEALAAHMNTETEPTVRRAVHEAIYAALDENTGYLEAWISAAGTAGDRARISDGYEAVVHDQAQVLARVLRSATPLGTPGHSGVALGFSHPSLLSSAIEKGPSVGRSARSVYQICLGRA